MSRFTLEAKVGLFFLATLAIFGYVWFYVLHFGDQEGFILKAAFRSVEGLEQGSQVQIAGIKVGTVKTISFDPEAGKAVVDMAIKDQYLGKIPEGSRVFLKTKGLFGDKYVIISPGKPNARKLKPGEEIKLVFEPTDTAKVIENMGMVAQDLKVVTRQLRREVIDKGGSEKVDSVLTNSDVVFRDLRSILARNKDRINRTFVNTDSATKKLNELVRRNEKKLNRTMDDLERFSSGIDKTGDKFNHAAAGLNDLVKEIRSGKGTLGKLVNDDTLYRDAQSLVRDVRQLSSSIQNGPGTMGRLINDPEIYYEARRAIRNMNKTAEDVSEATPVSTLAIILGSVFR
jgi:phospholipid/cholesterol/gamma-HCH transport system substrate-binding protein